MHTQNDPTTIQAEGRYAEENSTHGVSSQVNGNFETYPHFTEFTLLPDGSLAAVNELDHYEPHPVLETVTDWLDGIEASVRSTSLRIKQHPMIVDLHNNEQARNSLKQRVKYFLALVGLVGIAVIFFLFQLSKNVVLPPLTEEMVGEAQAVLSDRSNLQNNVSLAANSSSISPIFSNEVRAWESHIVTWSQQYGVDPNAVATIMQIESCGDMLAESYVGAQGLFQVMPFHFDAGESMKDPDTNAMRGIAYYKLGLELHQGDWTLAFAGYNGGHGTVTKPMSQWPHETQRYHYWAEGIYADALAGAQSSPRLQEWMEAGGASLCRQASSRQFPMTSN